MVEFDHFRTDAVKNYLIPACNYREELSWLPYAEEAVLLKVALFGFTSKAWREANSELAKKNNVRDYSSINELTVLSNLETHNAQRHLLNYWFSGFSL